MSRPLDVPPSCNRVVLVDERRRRRWQETQLLSSLSSPRSVGVSFMVNEPTLGGIEGTGLRIDILACSGLSPNKSTGNQCQQRHSLPTLGHSAGTERGAIPASPEREVMGRRWPMRQPDASGV